MTAPPLLAHSWSSVPDPDGTVYPDSDGKPMADNTTQFRWIVTIKENLDDLFRDDPDVFVAGDLLWYPVQGHREINQAPDTLVVFGRPKGERGSYIQHREGGIAPQVVFEVLSPNNTPDEMERKLAFYQQHGVEEYYVLDPDPAREVLTAYHRQAGVLVEVPEVQGLVSPRLGIRFDVSTTRLQMFHPDTQRFLTFGQIAERLRQSEFEREMAVERRREAEDQAERERQQREQAEQRADQERQRADQERQQREQAERAAADSADRIARLTARLREAGLDPEN